MAGGVNRTPQRPTTQPTSAAAPAQRAQTTQAAGRAVAGASASASGTVRSDGFLSRAANAFSQQVRSAVSAVTQQTGRLSQNPLAQQALNQANPLGLINQAQSWATGQINNALAGREFSRSGSVSGSRGTLNQGQVGQMIDGARTGASLPQGMIPQREVASGSRQVSQGTQDRLNAAGQRFNQIAQGAQQLQNLAGRLGINLPSYDRSASVSDQRTLATSRDGRGTVTAGGGASGSVHAGIDGVRVQGQANYGISAQRSDSVSTSGRYGTASAGYTAQAGATAQAQGSASLDANGLNAQASARVGVSASVEANARAQSQSINVGGVPMNASASVRGQVEAGAAAYAEGSARVTPGPPPAAVVQGTAGAYAGARARIEGTASAGPFSVSGHAEGWAGAGAQAGVIAGYENGRLSFGVNAGAALGLGGEAGFRVDVDVAQIGRAATGLVNDAADSVRRAVDQNGDGRVTVAEVGTAVQNAGRAVEQGVQTAARAVEDGARTVARTVDRAATTVANAASSAANAVGGAVSGAASRVGSFIRSLW